MNIETPSKFTPNFPLRFTLASFFFLYVLQYPLLHIIVPDTPIVEYSIETWLLAYCFVIYSVLLVTFGLKFGLAGLQYRNVLQIGETRAQLRKPSMTLVFILFAIFAAWSHIMVNLKIGITIYTEFDPLPFKLVGLLYYGRLIIQPLLLLYIANAYSKSSQSWLIVLLLLALGSWASMTSGSRLIAVMFALPLFLAVDGKKRWICGLAGLWIFITVASLARNVYLPFVVGGDLVEIYGNDADIEHAKENILLIPLVYLFVRTMGISEVMMTLSYGSISPTILDSLITLLSAFVPLVPGGQAASIRDIYGVDDSAIGGYGLGYFPNYWVMYGGTVWTYTTGLLLTGFLLGKTFKLSTGLILKLGYPTAFLPYIFVLLFVFSFEARVNVLMGILIFLFMVQHRVTIKLFKIILRSIQIRDPCRKSLRKLASAQPERNESTRL